MPNIKNERKSFEHKSDDDVISRKEAPSELSQRKPAGSVMGGNIPADVGASVPADSEGHNLHAPLDRLSQEEADADPYAVSQRDIEGIRLGRFSEGIMGRANAILVTIMTLFQQYLQPYLQPLWNTVTLNGGVWRTAQRAFQGAKTFLKTNQQQLMSALGVIGSVAMFILKFTVGAAIILWGMARDGFRYFKDARKPGLSEAAEGDPEASARRAGDDAEGWMEAVQDAAGRAGSVVYSGAESLLNGQILSNFRNFIRDEEPAEAAAAAGSGSRSQSGGAHHIKTKSRRAAQAAAE